MPVRRTLFFFNAAFATAILELISPFILVHKEYRPNVSECNAEKQLVRDYNDIISFKSPTKLTVLSGRPTIPTQCTVLAVAVRSSVTRCSSDANPNPQLWFERSQ